MNGRVAKESMEERKAPREANLIGTVTDKGSNGSQGKGKGKSGTRYCYDCGEQAHWSELSIQVDQQRR